MGKFEKGQWVRRTNGTSFSTVSGHHGPGLVGQVEDIVSDGYGDEVVFTNGHKGFSDQYEPWQPKVGERVRVPASAKAIRHPRLEQRQKSPSLKSRSKVDRLTP